jgi:probable HAF family extracellular repeat protein
MVDLGVLPNMTSTCANSVNSLGQIVGTAYSRVLNSSHAVIYGGGTVSDLNGIIPHPAGWTLGAADTINDAGMICGRGTDSAGNQLAFFYNGKDAAVQIPSLGGAYTGIAAMNNSGVGAGMSFDTSGTSHAIVYGAASGTQAIPMPPGVTSSYARGINDHGQVVGTAATGAAHGFGFLYTGGEPVDLLSLVDPSYGWTLLSPYAGINDQGDIAGVGYNQYGQQHAFLMMPTPEPTSLALLGVAAAVFAAYQTRRRVRPG